MRNWIAIVTREDDGQMTEWRWPLSAETAYMAATKALERWRVDNDNQFGNIIKLSIQEDLLP